MIHIVWKFQMVLMRVMMSYVRLGTMCRSSYYRTILSSNDKIIERDLLLTEQNQVTTICDERVVRNGRHCVTLPLDLPRCRANLASLVDAQFCVSGRNWSTRVWKWCLESCLLDYIYWYCWCRPVLKNESEKMSLWVYTCLLGANCVLLFSLS